MPSGPRPVGLGARLDDRRRSRRCCRRRRRGPRSGPGAGPPRARRRGHARRVGGGSRTARPAPARSVRPRCTPAGRSRGSGRAGRWTSAAVYPARACSTNRTIGVQSGGVGRTSIAPMTGPRRLLIGALVVLLALLDRQGARRHRPHRTALRGRHGDPAARRRALAGRRAAVPRERVHVAARGHPAVPLPAVRAAVLRAADRAAPDAGRGGRRGDHAGRRRSLRAGASASRGSGCRWSSPGRRSPNRSSAPTSRRSCSRRSSSCSIGRAPRRGSPRSRDVADPAESAAARRRPGHDRRRDQGLAAASRGSTCSATGRGPRSAARSSSSSSSRRRCP